MSTDRHARGGTPTSVQSKSNSKKMRMTEPPSSVGRHGDSRSSIEAPLASSESGDDSSDADKGIWSPEGCCTVNVTTTFVPHKVMVVGHSLLSRLLTIACSLYGVAAISELQSSVSHPLGCIQLSSQERLTYERALDRQNLVRTRYSSEVTKYVGRPHGVTGRRKYQRITEVRAYGGVGRWGFE